ncbi:hypothetical protein [uncultured Tateyamaria sp.]|uniref:hypothetical protein n=1 Tax=uncultured Tateyamaria sp. TaxID=455651 RepID=UPI00261CB8F0|nr:hypothetical protein [uncultured Tateyamaria sp.]
MMRRTANALWCHRTAYAGLAAIYGAGCLGLVDKDVVAQGATAIYVALTVQQH